MSIFCKSIFRPQLSHQASGHLQLQFVMKLRLFELCLFDLPYLVESVVEGAAKARFLKLLDAADGSSLL